MSQSPFLKTLKKQPMSPNPMWFMRQAGRYLPEYREVRAKAGSFLDLCFTPELACEVTIQPIRRYDLDAAILFADILLLPMFMGQTLTFAAGEGPRLSPALNDQNFELSIDRVAEGVSPVMETIKLCREQLSPETALIGFAGAPWTVATYMIAGQGVKDPAGLRSFAYSRSEEFSILMELLEKATIAYLKDQIRAGVQTVQLFESWASGLPAAFLKEYCLKPAQRIASAIRKEFPEIPVIAFPKGAGYLLEEYAKTDVFAAVSIDYSIEPGWAAEYLSPHTVVQGGLDPLLVVQGVMK